MTLSIQNLTFRLKQRSLIENISLEFKTGGLYGVLGPNGSGKSTLLKTISSIWPPTSGEIRWQGVNLQTFSRFELSKTVTLVPQDPPLFFDSAVLHMVSMGCYGRRSRTSGAPMIVEEALRQVDGLHLQNRMLSELSGGERQRVYIARALATQAPILLLDEPTSYLDLQHQLEIWHLLRILAGQGKLIIAAVHDFSAAERFCDEIVVLQGGRCKANGPYDHVMTEQILQEVFGVKLHPVTGLYQLVSS